MVSRNNSNTTDTLSPTIDQITLDHLLFLVPTDHLGLVLISKKLTSSDNYNSWRISMVIALNAKNKMKIVNGDFEEPVLKAYNMVRQEEKQREGLLPKPATSAAFSVYLNNQRSYHTNNNYQRNYNRSNYSQGESSTQGERKGSFKNEVINGNCSKEGHTREQCYKLVGYPDQNKRIAHGTLCNGLYLLPLPTVALKSHHTFSAITQPNNSSL
ncbi:cysteine-rich receptor-like protein kinase 8 [Tanacetum coccineum]